MNYMIVQLTPPAISNIGWRTYIIFAALNALWVPIIFFFFPETKRKCRSPLRTMILVADDIVSAGLELEDVDRLFAKKHSALAVGLERRASKDIEDARVEEASKAELA
jgi:hypothetical protein